jgi:SAM-dependent methyltransferase
MVRQISEVLRSHPDYGKRKLNVVDIGGGKGLLSNLLAETFGEDIVDVQVIDISTRATNNGMMRARRRGLENIRFDAMDATKVDIQTKKDLIVALHACGALSDVALGHALCQGAGFVICPCCFNSNPHLRVSVPVKGGDVELVSADDFLRVDPESYTSLKQLAELQGDIKLASKAMHTIIALRAAAVDRLWSSSKRGSQEKIYTSIKTFPIGFSTRNFCLVGKFTP